MKRLSKILETSRILWHGLCLMLLLGIGGGSLILAESGQVPLDPDVAGKLLAQTLKTQMVGAELVKDDLHLKITGLNDFFMDWGKAQFNLDCGFIVKYDNGFFDLEQSGSIVLSGAGLMSAPEQKLGVKLLQISALQLEGFNKQFNAGIQSLLQKGLAGREFWYDQAPASSEILTKDNLGTLLSVALNQILPQQISDEDVEVVLNRVDQIAFGEQPGIMQARVSLDGVYQKLFKVSFSGEAGVKLRVLVNPEQLAGTITVEDLTDLQLDRSPALLDNLLRKLINNKLRGKTTEFSWK